MRERNSTLRWLSAISGPDRIWVAALALVQAALVGTSVLYAFLLRSLIDEAVAGNRDGLIRSALLLIALMLGQLLLRAANRFLKEYSAADLENRLKERLFSQLLRKDYAAVTALHSGEWMNRLTNDTAVVAKSATTILPNLAGLLVRLVGAVWALVYLEPRFAMVLIPGGVVVMLLTYAFRRILKVLHKRIQEADGRLRSFLQERLSSQLVLRSFGVEKQSEKLARERMKEHLDARLRRNHISNVCNLGYGLMIQGATVGSAIYCAVHLMGGTLSYGTLMAVLQLVGQIQTPFTNISGIVPEFYGMMASAERLREAESFPEDGGEPREERQIQRFYEKELISLGLENASFTYQPPVREAEEQPMPVVLDGLSLQIRKGEFAAFTGHSGSGKSTVLKLLMSIYPLDSGERYLETAQGRQQLDAGWRGLFAYVPQGNALISGSIREIIAFGDREKMRREDELWTALRIACAEDFVASLDKGLDSELGESGAGLSEGQMQRIAIARAVFSARPVLLLDEATSSLDGETEKQVLENLRSMTDRTVLIVTHRPAALAICDKQIRLAGE